MLTLLANCFGREILFPLTQDVPEIRAGSLPDNTIYLPYKGVSRHHFRIIRKDEDWIVEDLDSKNGTYINGKPISGTASIHPGDTIQVGTVKLAVQEATNEIEPLRLTDTSVLKKQEPETDKLGHLPISEREIVFSFPKLVFPEDIIPGKSAVMNEVFQKLQAIADSDVSVLFYGETGVGKEVFAQTLHLSGKRSRGPFLAVNCAAIPQDLAEAELFGIGEKVATNVGRRRGKMMMAHGGTLFLDELSSFPLELQAKILRAIETRHIAAVGEHQEVEVNFRLITATNEPPKKLLQAGRLREDLYHRIATVEIHIPPLRHRKGDIEFLTMRLLEQISKKEGKYVPGMSKRLFAVLQEYSFPGNVRELRNILNSMVALAHPGEVLDVHLLPEKLRERKLNRAVEQLIEEDLDKSSINLHHTIDDLTRKLILHALKLNQGNITRAAQYLNVTTFGLRKMMKRLAIDKNASEQLN